jgi:hypothetical protein
MLGPSGRDDFVEEGADEFSDSGPEAPALLGEVLVVAVRSVDLTVHLLDGTKHIGGVEHLQFSEKLDRRCAEGARGGLSLTASS